MKISIITCFHNSERRLPAFFRALTALDAGSVTVEAVFVDNASGDGTADHLAREALRLPWPARVIREPKPGLMHARCAGVDAATGEWVLFLDDDNEPRADYLTELRRLTATFPEAVFISGNCVPPPEYGLPDSMVQSAGYVALRSRSGEFEFDLVGTSHPNGPWGAGLFCRRDELSAACASWRAGDCRITGRTGTGLSGGEDHWIIHYLCRERSRCAFSDRLVLVHRLDRHRLEPRHLVRVAYQLGADTPDHVDAFRALRPTLPKDYPQGWRVLTFFLVQLPRAVLRYWRRGTLGDLLWLCQSLGMGQSLALRRWFEQAGHHAGRQRS
ncbi:MAG: glycosyltransferase family 2 protein [Verrucomicrobiales bacterium]|nr:glycosyltransferase family 2 protein [Verrucomicrobiales bacterium]